MRRVSLFLLTFLATAAPASAADDLRATITRTAHGIPHITASSWAGIGYGYGYAFAEDNLCVMADDYVTVRGERSRYFGPDGTWKMGGNGTTNTNLDSDFFYERIIKRGTIEKLLEQAPPLGPRPEIREGVRGYVAGYNRYLADVGVDNLPDPTCRGKEWVKPIEEIDAYRRFYQLALLASSGVAINGQGGAQPPAPGDTASLLPSGELASKLAGAMGENVLGGLGSNAYGFGREKTDNGKGMLLGNPHFPWDGTERFYQAHLTIPGKLDVSGGSLFGVPIVLIGHTRGLAWSHTVSTAYRFTPYQLTLVPGSPTTYLVDGQPKEMERDELSVDVKQADGSIKPQTRTLYTTQWGPVFDELLGIPLPWTQGNAFAMGDANVSNFRYLNHFLETNLAQSVSDYDAVLRRNQGIPWVNSIAADSAGNAYYADISVVPHVTDEQAQSCGTALGAATFQLLRLPVLDGSRGACAWGTDPSAVQPGIFGPTEHLPALTRADYAGNSNDSFWLANPHQPLEGFPQIVGDERTARSLRTRSGLVMVEEAKKLSLKGLQDLVFSNRQYAGELWHDDTVAMCEQDPSLAEACPVLKAWDLRDDLDSKGALLWRRYVQRLLPSGPTSAPAPFAVPFDPADPVNTPRGLNTGDPRVPQALRDAVSELKGLGIPLDAPLRDVQAETRNGERIPIHGGPGTAGVFNAINVVAGDLEAKTGYGTIPHGSSFVQAVQFVDGSCPVVPRTILTYSESTNPQSPWFSDQTRMFSRKEWNAIPFCAGDVKRAAISVTKLPPAAAKESTGRCRVRSARLTAPCGLFRSARVRGRRAALVTAALTERASLRVTVKRGKRTVSRFRSSKRGNRYRLTVPAKRLARRGTYRVTFRASSGRRVTQFTVRIRRR